MIEATRLRRVPAAVSVTDSETKEYRLILFLGLIHLPLGILLYSQPTLGYLHQLVVFSFAFYCAGEKRVKLERVTIMVAYIMGAEVLWRMASVSLLWEGGKYVSSLILVVALLRRSTRRIPLFPVLYFLALLPACIVTLGTRIMDPETVQSVFSSTMSGPLFLAVSCIFFANVEVTPRGVRRILVAIIVPLLSVAFATLFYTVSADEIQFNGESNFATSGGFGPNQVSAMLGLGAFAALLLLIIFHNSFRAKIVLSLVGLFMAAQSAMTFSRGGLYAGVGATLVASLALFREPRTAVKRLAPIALAALIFLGFVFPFMDDWTSGSLGERFEDTEGTHRTEIVEADIYIFLGNPLFGAGVGNAYGLRQEYLNQKAMSHTEFSRLLSEHGLFGVVALLSLITIAVKNIRRQRTMLGRAFAIGVLAWATLFMLNAGMRLAAPSFMWGLAFITIVNERANLRRSIRKPEQKRLKEPLSAR